MQHTVPETTPGLCGYRYDRAMGYLKGRWYDPQGLTPEKAPTSHWKTLESWRRRKNMNYSGSWIKLQKVVAPVLYILWLLLSLHLLSFISLVLFLSMRYVFIMTYLPLSPFTRVIVKLSQWPTNSFSLLYPLSNLVSGHFPLPVCHPLHLPCSPVFSRHNQAPSAPSKFRWMFFPSGVLFHFLIHGSLSSPPSVMCLNVPLCCQL